ncbi:type 1 fimbrial protein [Serratia marcescens]|uniref:fimbrial protein n=1 Tax=Serratia TaxID=613 RepID=UPI000B611F32|nr:MULTISPECIES: fimbrial protein [Serratia]ASM15412.1 pilin [Serratia marcescens]MBH2789665.1 type 1 fimbrial protein [Serratia marcescens]MBH3278944.1 type 1 fimbrial protein [Serratia marcescens]MBH3319518.1 type 1 fimbrial protein [Serratia ureilytica]MBI6200246.1 type 1 fimbrial protein [Serratia marcescens]
MHSQHGKRILHSAVLVNLLLCSSLAHSANQGRGEVTVNGRIIASACAIDTESGDQTITMATLPVSQIIRDGQGELHEFTIKLVNCTLEKFNPELDDWRYFAVTFDGREDAGLFGVDGNAKGIALQISDTRGNVAAPGMPMAKNEIQSDTMAFNYGLRLMGNNQVMKAGSYYSTVRFKMDYY